MTNHPFDAAVRALRQVQSIRAELGITIARAFCSSLVGGPHHCICKGDWSRCNAPKHYSKEAATATLAIEKRLKDLIAAGEDEARSVAASEPASEPEPEPPPVEAAP